MLGKCCCMIGVFKRSAQGICAGKEQVMEYSRKFPEIEYAEIQAPTASFPKGPVDLTDATMEKRRRNILKRMEEKNLDTLLIYADREHGGNFGYLTGFEPRFEEAALALHQDGTAVLLLGNENMKMAAYSRILADTVHVPYFSLPNQPMGNQKPLWQLIEDAGIRRGSRVGAVGWKLFTSRLEDNTQLFDLPNFLLEALKKAVGETGAVVNATGLFIHPKTGARIHNNANEIAHYEYGAALASCCMMRMLDQIEEGKTEIELASFLASGGQPVNVQTICATGDRFTNAVVAPRNKTVSLGDKFSSTLGFRGGLTSRSGYIARTEEDLPEQVRDYLEAVAKPYYRAALVWYETMGLGLSAERLYHLIEEVLPRNVYGWTLNPGHYVSDEEWMASPFYEGSQTVIESGMMFQMDIIPSVPGYGGVSAEDGIAVADERLRKELEDIYPEVWKRIEKRRAYMEKELGICLKPEILPLSDTEGYLRPFLLNRKKAFRKK